MADYQTILRQWAIFRCDTPHNILVARFRTRGDAEGYLRVLRGNSSDRFEIIFDPREEVNPG